MSSTVMKKHKVATIPAREAMITSADQCTRALEEALEAMEPPLNDNVHGGILRLIAEFMPWSKL